MSDAAHVTQQPNANEPTIHARPHRDAKALCGALPGSPWTKLRSNVTCEACRAEIEQRIRARGGHR